MKLTGPAVGQKGMNMSEETQAGSGLSGGLGAVEPLRWSLEWNQQKCLDLGFEYWRAPDAHGVKCTKAQAVEFIQEMLGVEVEIEN